MRAEGYDLMENKFREVLKYKKFMIMDHRGFWGGNIIQNTRKAAMLSYMAGADIVEIDVCRTSDGEYYLFHDGNEKVLLGEDRHFSKWTSEEIDSTSVINTTLTPSGYYVEKLKYFLEWLPEGKLINIDRSWFYFDDLNYINILRNSNKIDQMFLKSPVEEKYLEELNKLDFKVPFIPIVKKKEDLDTVLKYKNINTIGVEVIANSENHELFDCEWLLDLENKGYIILANSINLGVGYPLFANLTDDQALTETSTDPWGKMLDMGVNAIQTDWPNFLAEYRRKFESR